jgi:hypothetical protein
MTGTFSNKIGGLHAMAPEVIITQTSWRVSQNHSGNLCNTFAKLGFRILLGWQIGWQRIPHFHMVAVNMFEESCAVGTQRCCNVKQKIWHITPKTAQAYGLVTEDFGNYWNHGA